MGILVHQVPTFSSDVERADYWQPLAADSVVIVTRGGPVEQAAHAGRLSLRAAFGGRVTHTLGDTRLAVDDDAYLVVNPASTCETHDQVAAPDHYVAVYFSEPTVRRCLADYNGHVFNGHGSASETSGAIFSEHLRPNDRQVTPLLRALIAAAEQAEPAGREHVEAQAEQLLRALLTERHLERERINAMTHARARTRQEIHRRVSAATDYLLTHYDEPVNLQQLADVACLAKFHFLRMFVAVHRITPMEYLRCKRVAVASRLLRADGVSLGVVAKQVGVADRSTLLRLFIDYRGTTPDQYRRSLRANAPAAAGDDALLADLVDARANAKTGDEAGAHLARGREPRPELAAGAAD